MQIYSGYDGGSVGVDVTIFITMTAQLIPSFSDASPIKSKTILAFTTCTIGPSFKTTQFCAPMVAKLPIHLLLTTYIY